MLVITAREERGYLGGRTVAGPGIVGRVPGSVDAEPGLVEADGKDPVRIGGKKGVGNEKRGFRGAKGGRERRLLSNRRRG